MPNLLELLVFVLVAAVCLWLVGQLPPDAPAKRLVTLLAVVVLLVILTVEFLTTWFPQRR